MVQRSLFGDDPAPDRPPGEGESVPFDNLDAARDAARGCVRCDLSTTRRQVVFGQGHPSARLVILGEGPSEMDDRSSHPPG